MTWLQTYTGRRFDLLAPRPESIVVEDLCHALACLTRYTGHARRPYTVAEHSCRVSCIVPLAHRRAALLHDATEAYVNDLAAPIKRLPELGGYRDLEHRIWLAVCARFGIAHELPAEVKRADLVMLEVERRVLLGEEPYGWDLNVRERDVRAAVAALTGRDPDRTPEAWEILTADIGWAWDVAKERLLEAFEDEGIR